MHLRMWTYDLAREQSPNIEQLLALGELSLNAGYNALGLYMEHRFAYPSLPWAHGKGAVTPEMVQILIERFPELQIIPFVNLLGHFEGMLYAEPGVGYAAERFKGMQADPTNPRFVELATRIIDDTIGIFKSEIIHIGGDETFQLGRGLGQSAAVNVYEQEGALDGKAELYGRHFGPLAARVTASGRRPAVWGDMFFEHPTALAHLPKETILFDWEYFKSPRHTAKQFTSAGYDVVLSPTLHTYNATWLHLAQSEQNVRDHVAAAQELDAYGVCVTTWETGLFGNYETMFPAIAAAGKLLVEGNDAANAEAALTSELRFLPAVHGHKVPEVSEEVTEVVSNFVRRILESGNCRWVIEADSNAVEVASDGNQVTTWDLSVGKDAVALILGLAGHATGISRPEKGYITGQLSGRGFELTVHAEPTVNIPRLVVASNWSPPSTPMVPEQDPTHAEAIAAYARVDQAPAFLRSYLRESERHETWARIMGIELAQVGGLFAFGGIRSSLKCRFLLYSNPFLLWLRNRDDLAGPVGVKALEVLDRAVAFAPDAAHRGVAEFAKIAIQFVQHAEEAHRQYALGDIGRCLAALAPARANFDDLAKIAKATHFRVGGSLADIERCRIAKEHVERVMRRIKDYGDGSLGYVPSFETITHPKFVPHDQANWWLINDWANE